MDDANRAKCWALRNQKVKYTEIQKLVRKTDGTRPKIGSIAEAAKNYGKEKGAVGRPEGSRKTTKAEDRKILNIFHKLRPPGHYVDSRKVHRALPKKLRGKIGRETVITRLAEKGYKPQEKMNKQAFAEAQVRKRLLFQKAHEDWTQVICKK